MKNEEILKENNGKRFSVILMNPPYGTDGSQDLQYKFVVKCFDIADKQITVMPFSLINKRSSKANKYKDSIDKYLINVEEISSKIFKGTAMNNVGIYYFTNNKNDKNIHIDYLDNTSKDIDSLHNINNFKNEIENNIYKLFTSNILESIYPIAGIKNTENKNFIGNGYKRLNKIKEYYKSNNDWGVLIVNDANGGMNGTYMSSRVGQIFTSYSELEKFIKEVKPAYNAICLKNKHAAENCKISLNNNVLRFLLYRIQDDQHMHISKCYKHIPNIDWSDDRVKTDEGLLEVCGCPKDKCKEYAEYCKNIIKQVDKK